MCGEKYSHQTSRPNISGSPPRVRGEVTKEYDIDESQRITPACAGRSRTSARTIYRRQDHPRVCGEKPASRSKPRTAVGSPPRVRGEDGLPDRKSPACRITPACAGRSRSLCLARFARVDHPRVCGEKVQMSSEMKIAQGSPPRVRGEDGKSARFLRRCRITPACAGRSP